MLEGLIAILIFSIALLGIIGLQAKSVQNSIHATYRADAGFYANQAIAQTMAGAFTQSAWQSQVAAALPNGNGTIVTNGTQLTVTVSWRLPSEPATLVHSVTEIAQYCAVPGSTTCS